MPNTIRHPSCLIAFSLLMTLTCHLLYGADPAATDPPQGVFFETDVRSILKVHCFHCHGEEPEKRGGLDLRLVRLMVDGGDSGESLVPGDPDASVLWQRIAADEMPEGPKKLSDEEKQIVLAWIAEGARTLRAEPDDVEAARFTLEERQHWAFQPVQRPPLPEVPGYSLESPIDAFVARKLQQHGLPFSAAATRATLIRRVTLDLTGLPPTPQEVADFIQDPSVDAYPKLVDRLLASPHYGVRWGRHWLDIAGYAETEGGTGQDIPRPHAWRYRDYVVDALNTNRPIDQFITEQLAGDELIGSDLASITGEKITATQQRQLTATGFLRMAPDPTQAENTLAERNATAANAVQLVSSALLGVTVGCAQCHDHKYDPIGTDDYYRFRAIFDPLFPLEQWQVPSQRLLDVTPPSERDLAAQIESQAKALEDDLNARRDAHCQTILEAKLADVPEADREATRAAVLTAAGERTPRQTELLDQYPMVKPVSYIRGLLIEYDMPAYRKFEAEQQEISAIRAKKPSPRQIRVATERAGVVPTSHVLFRGDPESPMNEVTPGELTVLSTHAAHIIPSQNSALPTTGRRLSYAQHLTDGNHPLTARVFVNRIWLHHFGQGLVATPSDFGMSGAVPSHPELLDWLADEFVSSGWDLKRLHRLMVLSTTYQQQSVRRAELDAVDPENEWYGRMSIRRLSAEELRDALLYVGDSLASRMSGPSAPVTENSEGKVVLGTTRIRDGLPVGVDELDAASNCRSLFVEMQRKLPLQMLEAFDLPVMNPNCPQRSHSTVATQALWFLNDAMVLQQSEIIAEALHNSVGADEEDQIRQLYQRLFSVGPSDEEMRACREFLEHQRQHFQRDNHAAWQKALESSPDALHRRAFATLCQTLLASNRFLYVD